MLAGAGVTAVPARAFAATVPGPPTGVVVTVGHNSLSEVEWHRPASNGGSRITNWLIRQSPDDPGDYVANVADYGDHLAAQSAGEYGVTYRYAVAAENEVGVGPWSASAAPVTPIPLLSIANVGTPEGNSGTHLLSFTAKLDYPSAAPVTVAYATAKAGAGTDFLATSGNLTFAPGQSAKTIRVPVIGDTVYELGDKVTVRLSAVAGAEFGKRSATGTIVNDDPVPTLRVANASKTEGAVLKRANVKVPVTLSAPTGSVTKVHWAASNGTATGARDYALASGTVKIGAGKTAGTILIPILGDGDVEPNETILVDLDQPVGATIADGHAVVTIVNDD